ncbi:MAG TPA: DUF4956 domain-containing protein [Gemmatimonadaceae bacterium]|nr:DUF4956 domain-containing protein [Gemmatimonadaceae bacterium]
MDFFRKLINFVTLGSSHPLRRLVAYYAVLAVVVFLLYRFFPIVDQLLSGEGSSFLTKGPQMLTDGLNSDQVQSAGSDTLSRLELAITNTIVFISTLALMLPVSWVYMSARKERVHNQSIVQTLLILPMVVAGVILIVRNSLALAFSLAGVVAAVRFRTSLRDARDVVFIFLAIAVGFAAGVQVLSVAALLSMIFNFVLVLIWRYDFGRNVLEPTAASQWTAPLSELVVKDDTGMGVPDRDLVLALTPKKVEVLRARFKRVGSLLGTNGKKPRYDAVLSITTGAVTEAQQHVERALDEYAKRWKLDEVVTNAGKPSELYYLVRTRKSVPRDVLLTAIRADGGGSINSCELEVGEAIEQEVIEQKETRKEHERSIVQ